MYTPIIVPKKWEKREQLTSQSEHNEYYPQRSNIEGLCLFFAIIILIMFAITIKENSKL